ncbi:uncharacterized protein J8A68_001985 [[Candida] subhashii]|uniref:Zinc finger PHD-type domain-containing protein n=1 Tax=[Candida] subhashii TaxID=561895 RepID=A0A8J5QMZ7_9ASCO|nr:uncharacterized protein J8A68_001985 [[Candida] subhashii]KAG7664479.1 hypothetical protein J8A68_001985 [[Candida] subhashii]
MNIEEEEIYPSHTITNSFISTVDHLPCDIVRSLWVIQSCNFKISKAKEELNDLLIQYYKTRQISGNQIERIINLKQIIRKFSAETIEESRAINNQLITHKLNLAEELDQLQKIQQSQSSFLNDNSKRNDELRHQLKKHYAEHPLASQREALEEQDQQKQQEKQRQQLLQQRKQDQQRQKTGLKLILKIPKEIHPKPKQSSFTLKIKPTITGKSIASGKVSKSPKERTTVIKPVKDIPTIEPEPEVSEEQEEDKNSYCFCKQGSFGDMIACDNEESCQNGEWFHYKCVGLLNRVEALKYTTGKVKWFCSDECRRIVEEKDAKSKEAKKKKRKRRW